MIQPQLLHPLQASIAGAAGRPDGWLLFDFRGSNPIMAAVIGREVVGSRRSYVFIPRDGIPTALVHAIDGELWRSWPAEWRKEVWVTREELARLLPPLIGGKRIAVEYSPNGAVPYLDYVPAGVLEFLRGAGAEPMSSAELVTRFCSVWDEADLASHRRAARIIAEIGQEAIALAGARAATADPITEGDLGRWILDAIARAGLVTQDSPSVSYGANAARNHYDPLQGESARITPGALLLVDLWGKEPGGVYADQTWMGAIGAPSPRNAQLWEVVREARDAALDYLRAHIGAGPVTGAEVDRAARAVITRYGLLGQTQCRTGHSIDRFGIHGFGPTIDDTESFDERLLIPGVGFSIEPGIYFPGEVGVRSEVNVHVGEEGVEVTPGEYQRELLVV